MSQRQENPPSTIFRPETAQTGGVGTPIAALLTVMKPIDHQSMVDSGY